MKSSGSRLRGGRVNVGAAVVVFGLLAVAVAVVLAGADGVRSVADSLWSQVLEPLWSDVRAYPLMAVVAVVIVVGSLWFWKAMSAFFRRR